MLEEPLLAGLAELLDLSPDDAADTVRFFSEHKREIGNLLGEMCEETGEAPAGLFGDKWDKEDPLALDTYNQNLLAWFGFEEAGRRLLDRIEEAR